MSSDIAKRAAALKAAGMVRDGMVVGLGTGSTTAFAIQELGRRIREEGLQVQGTPTSFAAELLADEHDVPVCDLRHVESIDIAIDGADEVDPELNLIKGRGAAHTREKVIATLARRFVVLVDESKLVSNLGSKMPLPVEVLPMAAFPILRRLRDMGANAELRMGRRKDGPVVTDQGFWIIDARFGEMGNLEELDRTIKALPGVLEHGLFLGIATDILVGTETGDVRQMT